MGRPEDDDDDDAPPARRGLPRAAVAGVVVAALAVGGFFGARSLGWLPGSGNDTAASPVLQDAASAAVRVKLPPAAPRAASGASGVAAAASGVPQVQVTSSNELTFRRAGVSTRLELLSISSVAFGSDQHMLQIALRASNQGSLPLTLSTAPFRLVTSTQTLAPMDKLEETVPAGGSGEGLITFVVPAGEPVRALRVVLAGESQDLLLTQEGR